jgi:molybdopterin-guanine dinucleotide biosynthesis protein A
VTSKEHNKHTAITRPALGNFGRNEWAILGAPCTVIKLLADEVIKALTPQYNCAYADTSHDDDVTLLPGRLAHGASLEYTNQINYHQLNYKAPLTVFKQRELFAAADVVFVNGNHQQVNAQVVIIDINKQASLQKRKSHLTNVSLFLLADNAVEIFDFIKEAMPDWQKIPVLRLSDTAGIISFFKAALQLARPVLNGLVLAGGKSTRMGFDKGTINWYGKEQRYHVVDLLKKHCDEVYISCRDKEQQEEIDPQYTSLTDTFTGLGPFGAILSAFRQQPNRAWLVVACDLPLVNERVIQSLIDNRNPSSVATAFKGIDNGFPEPVITIYEPKSYHTLLQFLAQGYTCPRKVLINSDTTLLESSDTEALTNVNTPEELERIKRVLHQKVAATNAS